MKFVDADCKANSSIEAILTKYAQDIKAIIHPAQNFGTFLENANIFDKEIIQYTANSVQSFAQSDEASEAPIEIFFYFSMSVALRGPDYHHSHIFTKTDFREYTHEEATTSWIKTYTYAKVNAVKFILSYKSKRRIEYKVIVPPTVVGPALFLWNDKDHVTSNNKNLYNLFIGLLQVRGVE